MLFNLCHCNGTYDCAVLPQYVLMPGGPIPGECLPLNGSKGFLDIKLRSAIVPTALTYEHVPTSIAYDIRSAPQDMSVVGAYCLPLLALVKGLPDDTLSKRTESVVA